MAEMASGRRGCTRSGATVASWLWRNCCAPRRWSRICGSFSRRLKRDATDLVIQKATELGVSAFLPVFSARTNAARVNLDRLAAIALEAAEQSERLTLPKILPPVPLFDVLANWAPERVLAAAIERGGPAPIPEPAGALLVGPEGGFAPAELDALRAARFVSPICLGPRVLRAETAVIAGLALLQGRFWSTN